jgi:hypothetical protein
MIMILNSKENINTEMCKMLILTFKLSIYALKRDEACNIDIARQKIYS